MFKSSVIRQKGKSQNRCFKKAKHAQISGKQTFQTPNAHTYVCVSRDKKYLFCGNFGVLCFLETPVWDSPFCLITDEVLTLHSNHQCFPILWKWLMSSLHKKDRTDLKENYRAVSILPTLLKVFERIMFAQISAFFEKIF